MEASRALIGEIRKKKVADGEALKQALKDAIAALLAPLERKLDVRRAKPFVIMVAGVNGAGKTTSIGKLAKWLQSQGKSVMLAAGDTFRAAAREQLVAWGSRNAVPVIAQEAGDPGAIVFDALSAARARNIDVVIADTAGRLPTQLHLMEEIKKVKRARQGARRGAARSTARARCEHGSELACASEGVRRRARPHRPRPHQARRHGKGGVVCAIAKEKPVPLLFVGIGEGIDDLRPFAARDFAEALVG